MYTELNQYHEDDPIDAGRRGVASKATQRDQHMRYTHEMSYDTGETAARALIRTVPVVYGLLLGGLIGDLYLGLAVGLVLTIGLDSRMGENSMFRPLLGRVVSMLCPLLSALADAMRWFRLPLPAFLREPGCGRA